MPKRLQPKHDLVNHPKHYNQTIEVIDVIKAYRLGFNLGNVLKYVCRSGFKGKTASDALLDLKKARWYLDDFIKDMEVK